MNRPSRITNQNLMGQVVVQQLGTGWCHSFMETKTRMQVKKNHFATVGDSS